MNWIHIKSEDMIDDIKKESYKNRVLIFKYSPKCSINMLMMNMLEREWNCSELENIKTYFINIIAYRHISNMIESEFDVYHESPQVLIIENGKSIHDVSHGKIRYENLKEVLKCEKDNNVLK